MKGGSRVRVHEGTANAGCADRDLGLSTPRDKRAAELTLHDGARTVRAVGVVQPAGHLQEVRE